MYNLAHLYIYEDKTTERIGKSIKYLITSITGTNRDIKTVKFAEDSAVNAIYFRAFSRSKINEIQFPASLKELKEGWCESTPNLTKIEVSPDNPFFSAYDDKLIIRKSSIEEENYDILSFCVRDIKDITIPSFIKKIEPFSFIDSSFEKVIIPSQIHFIIVSLKQ